MPMIPVDTPRSDTYLRYYDWGAREWKFTKLLTRRGPIRYPFRLPEVEAEGKVDKNFDELNPSENKKHLYVAYLGLPKGFLAYLWHPIDIKILKLDEGDITDIDERLIALDYEASPYEAPSIPLIIFRDRYPNVELRNISGETKVPEVIWLVFTYKHIPHESLGERELFNLRTGVTPSRALEAGGED